MKLKMRVLMPDGTWWDWSTGPLSDNHDQETMREMMCAMRDGLDAHGFEVTLTSTEEREVAL